MKEENLKNLVKEAEDPLKKTIVYKLLKNFIK